MAGTCNRGDKKESGSMKQLNILATIVPGDIVNLTRRRRKRIDRLIGVAARLKVYADLTSPFVPSVVNTQVQGMLFDVFSQSERDEQFRNSF